MNFGYYCGKTGTFVLLLLSASRRRGWTHRYRTLVSGSQLHRADRNATLSGKKKGGGICFYINSNWCSDVAVLKQHCCPDLEFLFIVLRISKNFAKHTICKENKKKECSPTHRGSHSWRHLGRRTGCTLLCLISCNLWWEALTIWKKVNLAGGHIEMRSCGCE